MANQDNGGFTGGLKKGVADSVDPTGVFSGLSDVGSVLAVAWNSLSDITFWRSLGWIALGGLLVAMGIGWIVKDPAMKVAGAVAKVA